MKEKNYIQSTQDEGDPRRVDPSAALAVEHDQPAAIPGQKPPDGEREPGKPDGQPLCGPLPDAEPDSLLQNGRVAADDPSLRGERIHHLDGAERLRDDCVGLCVLVAHFSREEEEVSAVDQTRDYEQQQKWKCS